MLRGEYGGRAIGVVDCGFLLFRLLFCETRNERSETKRQKREERSNTSINRNPLSATCDEGTFRPVRDLEKREKTKKKRNWTQKNNLVHPIRQTTTPQTASFISVCDLFFLLSMFLDLEGAYSETTL